MSYSKQIHFDIESGNHLATIGKRKDKIKLKSSGLGKKLKKT
jgi:hypothetical protein